MVKCEWEGCDREIPPEWRLRKSQDGEEWTYLTEKGDIAHKHLTSELASKRASKTRISPEAKHTAAELAGAMVSVLVQADDPLAKAKTILIQQLAQAASKDSAQSIRAIEQAMTLVGSKADIPVAVAGELCPVCGLEVGFRYEIKMVDVAQHMGDEWGYRDKTGLLVFPEAV